ncbi:UDP-N-acetylmuramoyl-tripeptide--D-alanyl-D-alanine ligase [Alkalicoccobacillus porphyridii]|uniref:UDP-N-acetylmuramoyl-tripeptide--D-alanyl-D-alanine ligase n=1 Tax=Alkalicoccobacillus porphyridii TaxID=2597270 RepID=A0A553ZY01_9BACI|nr:UDP-N-acetylmuramoyl-tripeptide--D-alanyl-D-alanine ligase [Alkalicoccobacillus porphyridii]TSB46323.1 UDP-N-acetylmuramoyl-tripeptide--D-alanyl-D-alanine ligase [Alkalicoccobacillus porphyridii]
MTISHELVTKVAASFRINADQEQSFSSVSIDTRTLQKGALYVPIVGERFDGHIFIEKAIQAGAKAAVWQKDYAVPSSVPDNFQLYYVEDTLKALQQLSKEYRKLIDPIVIAVTGSNGKTTVKDMLFSILSLTGTTYKTQGNFNNHIGMPLTILGMPKDCKYLILEMGMSEFGEIEFLSELAEPDIALITNIGESHMEQLGSREGIAEAKAEIRAGLSAQGTLYIDGDEPLLADKQHTHTKTIGFNPANHSFISDVSTDVNGLHFTLADTDRFTIPLLGKHNVKNAALAASAASGLGLSAADIQNGLSQVAISKMRLERSFGQDGELIINDAYNASPTSMIAALETLKGLSGFSRYIAVLGDMYELGGNEKELHTKVAGHISAPITHVLCVGHKAKWIYEAIQKEQDPLHVSWAPTVAEAAQSLKSIVTKDSVVLLKASRGLKLEQIVDDSLESGKGETNK